MKEILFRGKTKAGRWVYGSLIVAGTYCCILEPEENVHPLDYPYLDDDLGTIDGQATPVIPETVGQYTEITDRFGKKIFEGDWVQLDDYVKNTFDINDGVIKDIGGCFLVGGSDAGLRGSLYVLTDMNWILRGAVVDNIYDNPELLEVVRK